MNEEIVMTEEYQAIIQAVDRGQACTFIAGRAGSGKTTLLHYMKNYYENAKKNTVLVAPTGGAALEAGGSTINSFFRFRHGILSSSSVKKPKDPSIFKELHILFIDEVSMVRADAVDAIDLFLRRARGNSKPFGGVQVVFIGDMFQIPPVVTDADIPLLIEIGYLTGYYYFFNAKVFNKVDIKNLYLTKIFRQKDVAFMGLLNRARIGKDNEVVVAELNRLCFNPLKMANPLAITLATTNAIADAKNIAELSRIDSTPVIYKGEIKGDFKVSGANLPALEKLVLKVGAVVMFTANDKDVEKRWVNGMLGKVVKLNKLSIDVDVAGTILNVGQHEWKSYEYFMKAGKISQKTTGSYSQFPVALGWAVTIHKSQGKTLKHLHINMGRGAFATGQTYVALSRAVDIEGMTFEKPLRVSDIKCCPIVKAYFEAKVSETKVLKAREQLSLI